MRTTQATGISARHFACVAVVAVVIPLIHLCSYADARNADGRNPPEPIGETVNPHWTAEGCGRCHMGSGADIQPIKRAAIDLLCVSCHDGRHAKAESHPIGRTFSSNQVVKPADWPAPNGRLSCITCHDVLRACRPTPGRPSANPAFLRGNESDLRSMAFCARCHVESSHTRLNPHDMLDEKNRPRANACDICHSADSVDPSELLRTGDARLRARELDLCGGCHKTHQDFFSPGHIGATPSLKIRAAMHTVDRLAGLTAISEQDTVLPLSHDGRVTCSTCHNPHSAGVFESTSVLSAGAMQEKAGGASRLGLRVDATGFCSACHTE